DRKHVEKTHSVHAPMYEPALHVETVSSAPKLEPGFARRDAITLLAGGRIGPARTSGLGVPALARPPEHVIEPKPGTGLGARVLGAFPDDEHGVLASEAVSDVARGAWRAARLAIDEQVVLVPARPEDEAPFEAPLLRALEAAALLV